MKKYLFVLYAVVAAIICLYFTYISNSDYLIETANLTPYYSNTAFFCDCMQKSGGLLVFAGSFLTSCFYSPLLGALLLILFTTLLALVIKYAFDVSSSSDAICFVPSLLLILSYTQLGYMIYLLKVPAILFTALLGLISAISIFWFYKTIRINIIKRLYPLIIVIFIYPLLGFYALFAILLILINDIINIKQTLKAKKYSEICYMFLYVLIAIIIPYIYYLYLYSRMRYADAYTSTFPDIQTTGDERYLRYPLFISLIFVALMSPYSKFVTNRYLGMSVSCLLFVVSIISNFKYTYDDENFSAILKMERGVDDDNWQQVIDVARTTSCEPTRLQVMFTRLALWEQGEAGNKMFNYQDGDTPYNSPRVNKYLRLIGARSLYYYFGKVNYSYRWCMEDMVEYGHRPAYLKYMVKCAIVNGEYELARKYLTILSDNPFTSDWAAHYMPYLTNPEKEKNDKEMQSIKKLMNYDNLLDGDGGMIEIYLLNSYASMQGGTKDMVELSLLCNMILKDSNGFWQRFLALLPTFNNKIPIHYQEAALMFSALEHKYDVSQLPIDQSVKQRFQALIQASSENGNNSDSYNATVLRPSYGDTYWYYYFFVKGMKTN